MRIRVYSGRMNEHQSAELRIAANVRAAAAAESTTQKAVAEALGMNQQAVGRRWNGQVAWSGGELVAVAELLKMQPADLLRTS